MGTKAGDAAARDGREARTASRRKAAVNALREEAERGWARSDRKAAKDARRSQSRARPRGEAQGRGANEGAAQTKRPTGKPTQPLGGTGGKSK